MKKQSLVLFLIFVLVILMCGCVSATSDVLTPEQEGVVINARIPFVENRGQTDPCVEYYADTFYGTVFVTDKGIVHSISGQDTSLVIKEEFLDENGEVINFQPVGVDQGTAKVDFYLGNDSNKWITGQSTWDVISLGELYPGITVLLRAYGGNVEKIFQAAPGADPELIKIQVTGADNIKLDENGNLNLQSIAGDVQLTRPIAYQEEQNIEVDYQLTDNTYGFQVGSYNTNQTLTIDPTLQYSTYLGGSSADYGLDIAVDNSGNIYITGYTYSSDFPATTGAYQTTQKGSYDIFISKLAPNSGGTADLLYSTYLGGKGSDYGQAIALHGGNIYITGYTWSTDFPITTGAYQTTKKGLEDAYICKLAPNGGGSTDLLYSTYLGGSSTDYGYDVAVDSFGRIYITGETISTDFPVTSGAYQTSKAGGIDAYFCRLAPNGGGSADLLYSTYLGGTENDHGVAITVQGGLGGLIYITGYTWSTDFPVTSGAYQTSKAGGVDVFISVFSFDLLGIHRKYSTYLGGVGSDYGRAIAADNSGYIYITGYTSSWNFPTTSGAYQTTIAGGNDIYISKLDPKGLGTADLLYSTFLGGISPDYGRGITTDDKGNIYVTGYTESTDFSTTPRAYQNKLKGTQDAFISKISPKGLGSADLRYSTYLGGNSSDRGNNIAIDSNGYIYITGYTTSTDFPTTSGAYQTVNHGNDEAFVVKLLLPLYVYPGESIQDAVNAAIPGGEILVVGPWTYIENLVVDRTLNIESVVGAVTIEAADTSQPVIHITSSGSDSTIKGFSITGATSSFGVYLDSADECYLLINTISDNFIGVYIQNSYNNTLSGNTIQNNGWVGVCLDQTVSNTINLGNVITGNVEGVYIVNSSNGNTITGNNIYGNLNAGLNILNGSTGNIISSNTAISDNGIIGVLIRDSDTNTISGNNIQRNGWAGVALDNADGNTINGANIIFNNMEGLNLTNSSGNNIAGNMIMANTNIGISLINGSNNNIISNNTAISFNGIIGVYLRNSSTNNISGNTIQMNSWVGICFDQATGNIIDGSNSICDNLEGLYMVNYSNNNKITANMIYNNYDTGIYIHGSTGNTINGSNHIDGNGVVGILLRGTNNNTIKGNTISGNTFAGIAMDNAYNNIINDSNHISGSQMGVYITSNSTGNMLTGNTFQNNTWAGLVLDYAVNTTVYQNNFIDNPLQALAQNGSGNAFYHGTTGNYWSDWPSTDPRSIPGSEGLYDQYPSNTPF